MSFITINGNMTKITEVEVRGNLPNRLFGETTVLGSSLDGGGEKLDDGDEMQEDAR